MNKIAFEIRFSNDQVARAAQIERPEELNAALVEFGLNQPRPTLVLVGGAAGLGRDTTWQMQRLFTEVLAPLARSMNAYVVDGATDSGVIQLIGRARRKIGATFPLIGVAAIGTIVLPNTKPTGRDPWSLEPHHTHFVFVPGSDWGDEVPWLARVATALTNGKPSVTILVNGGQVAWDDLEQSVKERRHVVVVGGSGRTADEIAATLTGTLRNNRAEKLIASGLIRVVELSSPEAIDATIRAELTKE